MSTFHRSWLRFCLWSLLGVLLSSLWFFPFAHLSTPAQTSVPAAFVAGRTAYEREDYDTAIAQWESLLNQTPDLAQQVTLLNNLSLAHQALGNWEAAQEKIETSLTRQGYDLTTRQLTQPPADPFRLAQSLDVYGQWHDLQGNSETAIALWQQAGSYYTPAVTEHFQPWFENQLNQARALQYLGYHLQAQQLLLSVHNALANNTAITADTHIDLAIALGQILRLVGQLDTDDTTQLSAVSILEVALEKWAVQANRDRRSALHLEFGNIQRALTNQARRLQGTSISGLPRNAATDSEIAALIVSTLTQYQQAAAIAATPLQTVAAQLNELSFRAQIDPSDPAMPSLVETLLANVENLPSDRPGLAAKLAFVHYSIDWFQTRPDLAPSASTLAALLVQSIDQAKALNTPQLLGEAFGLLGHLYEVSGQPDDALEATNMALSYALRIQQPELNYRLQWQLGRVLKQQHRVEAAIAAYTASVQTIQALRRDLVILNPDVQFSFRDDIEPVYRELADLLLHAAIPGQDQLQQTRVVMDSLHLLEVENYLRRSCNQASLEEVDKIVKEQDPTAAFLYTVVLGDTIDVISKFADSEELRYHTINALNKQQLDQKLYEFRGLLETKLPSFSDENRLKETASLFYEYLIQPISLSLEANSISTLVFFLDDSFLQIPLGTLFDSETQKYLLEEYAIAITPSLQLLGPKPSNFKNTRVLAGIVTKGDSERGIPALLNLQQQVGDIRAHTYQSEILLDEAFTASRFRQNLTEGSYSVVHLATHAEVTSQPENSFIVTGDFQRIRAQEMNDLIGLREQENPEPVELLFLSACNTAAGDARAPMGLAGMTVAAGARSAIASLWYAEDKRSTQLVREFYRVWQENPTWTKAKALQESQKRLIQNGNLEPVYWANYLLLGNWL